VKNDVLVFVAFGGGLTWANAVLRHLIQQPRRHASRVFLNEQTDLHPLPRTRRSGRRYGKGFFTLPLPRRRKPSTPPIASSGSISRSSASKVPKSDSIKPTSANRRFMSRASPRIARPVAAGVLNEANGASEYAGLSLGEYTALHLAGVFGFEDGLKLVAGGAESTCRKPPSRRPSSMVAIMGADEAAITKLCEETAQGDVLVPANFNAPGQIVVSGSKSGL